jgi:hypothetical protein
MLPQHLWQSVKSRRLVLERLGPPAAGSPKAKPNSAAANTEYVKQTLGKLNGYLPAAAKALQANDVGKAKDYVKGFSDNWNQKIIQNSVKSQAPESHQKISAGVTQVNNLMKQQNRTNHRRSGRFNPSQTL